jgi:hypothetical protein
MVRARKPTGEDKELAVDTSHLDFEDDEEFKVGLYVGNNPYRPLQYLPAELEAVSLPSLFTPEVCDSLTKEFGFTDAQAAELARRIEAALDPDLNPLTLSVAQSYGERRGTASVERGFVALSDAQERISDALSALVPLRAITEHEDGERTLDSVITLIEQCQAYALDALINLDSNLRQKGLLYEPVVVDKRQVGAARRNVILSAIFEFWVWTGRKKATYTTNSGASEGRPGRSGRLIELCDAVFRLTRKDGRTVSGDTIAAAIRAWLKR